MTITTKLNKKECASRLLHMCYLPPQMYILSPLYDYKYAIGFNQFGVPISVPYTTDGMSQLKVRVPLFSGACDFDAKLSKIMDHITKLEQERIVEFKDSTREFEMVTFNSNGVE